MKIRIKKTVVQTNLPNKPVKTDMYFDSLDLTAW